MLFCQKCGTKAVEHPSSDPERPYSKGHDYSEQRYTQSSDSQTNPVTLTQEAKKKTRIGMTVLASVCAAFTVIYALISIAEPFMLSAMAFFGVLAVMFFVLFKSPKSNVYILGRENGLKKKVFVIICIVLAIVLVGIIGSLTGMETTSENSTETNTSDITESSNQDAEIKLTREEERFVQAFGCTTEQAKQMYAIFEEVGLTLSSADKVSRREDLDNWDNDGSIAYEIADVIRVDGEKQRAFLYVTNDFQVLDIRFLSCYLYENGAFVQTAEEAVNVGWAASLFETECPITVSASMTTDLIGTPVIEATISNNSSKNITAIKILAHPLDVYGNTIQNYGYGEEYTSLNSDEQISAGGSKTVSWSLYGYDATKTAELWVYSVYFEDGTQWGGL